MYSVGHAKTKLSNHRLISGADEEIEAVLKFFNPTGCCIIWEQSAGSAVSILAWSIRG